MKQENWLTQYGTSLQGKIVAITGATGGLGSEICRGILFLGGSLLLLTRSKEKTDVLIRELLNEFPGASIDFFPLDLQNPESVKKACRFLEQNPPDILLHNAGIYDVPRQICSTGLDNIFQVNFASPYCLTKQLLPALRQKHAHIVVVGSIAHTYSASDPNDMDFSARKACHLAYGNSKRYLMYAFSQLLKEETQVSFSIGHPGISLTNISNHYPAWLFPLIRPFLKFFFMKPETACRSILYAVCHEIPYSSWVGPRFLDLWGNPRIRPLRTVSSSERRQMFFSAEDMYNRLR